MGYETPKHPQMNQAESLLVDFGRAELSGAQCTGICFQLRPQNHLGWKKPFEIPQFHPSAQEQPAEADCPGAQGELSETSARDGKHTVGNTRAFLKCLQDAKKGASQHLN